MLIERVHRMRFLPDEEKINVTYNGKVIYSKEIFVSTQETKIITLP